MWQKTRTKTCQRIPTSLTWIQAGAVVRRKTSRFSSRSTRSHGRRAPVDPDGSWTDPLLRRPAVQVLRRVDRPRWDCRRTCSPAARRRRLVGRLAEWSTPPDRLHAITTESPSSKIYSEQVQSIAVTVQQYGASGGDITRRKMKVKKVSFKFKLMSAVSLMTSLLTVYCSRFLPPQHRALSRRLFGDVSVVRALTPIYLIMLALLQTSR